MTIHSKLPPGTMGWLTTDTLSDLRIVKRPEAARMLGISVATLDRQSREGKLPPKVRISPRRVGWHEGDLRRHLMRAEGSRQTE